MKPKITFLYNKKTTSLDVRIKIYGIPPGVYSSGISVTARLFDHNKQICGDPSVQTFMNILKSSLEELFRPGMTPEQIWNSYMVNTSGSGGSQTVADAFAYYLSTMTMAANTRRNFENTRSKATELLALPLQQVNAAVVRKFLNGLKGEKSSIHLVYVQLKTIIKCYAKDHNLKDMPNIDDISQVPKKEEAEEGKEKYLTFEEIKKLMSLPLESKVRAYVRDLFVITCFTGMAIADLVRFTTDWISPDGKWLVYQRQKTKHANRKCRIPILPLSRQLIYSHEWPTKLAIRTIQYHCEHLGKLLGKTITPHTGRHSFGSTMLYFGFSMESVREMMGHASVQTTERIYAKVSKEKIEREMQNIPNQMNEAFGN